MTLSFFPSYPTWPHNPVIRSRQYNSMDLPICFFPCCRHSQERSHSKHPPIDTILILCCLKYLLLHKAFSISTTQIVLSFLFSVLSFLFSVSAHYWNLYLAFKKLPWPLVTCQQWLTKRSISFACLDVVLRILKLCPPVGEKWSDQVKVSARDTRAGQRWHTYFRLVVSATE